MSEWKMCREDVRKLLDSYKKHKCLWDFRSTEYKRWDMKKIAWEQLSKLFGKEVDDVKKKVKYLRSAYVSEKKKVDKSYGSSLIYESSLFYYDDMHFLDSIIVCRLGQRFIQEDESPPDPIAQFEEQPVDSSFNERYAAVEDVEMPSRPITPRDSNLKAKEKQQRLTPYYSKLNEAINLLTEASKPTMEDSLYTSFGKIIALQLSQLPPLEATSTMAEIHQVLSRNIIQSMRSKSRGLSSRNVKDSAGGFTDKLSVLTDSVVNGYDA